MCGDGGERPLLVCQSAGAGGGYGGGGGQAAAAARLRSCARPSARASGVQRAPRTPAPHSQPAMPGPRQPRAA